MNVPRRIRSWPAAAVLVGVSLLSVAVPACSRKHRAVTGLVNMRPDVAITANVTSGPSPLTVSFSGVADDPDGTIVGWHWDFGDGEVATTQDAVNVYQTTGDFVVALHVSDDKGAYGTATDTIRVGGANQAPIVNAGIGQVNLDPGATVFLSGSATEPDGQPMTYQWTQIGGPAVTLVNATTLTPTFVSVAATTTSYAFRLSATDNGTPASTGSSNVSILTRVTWSNTTRQVLADHCTSCHYTSNPSSIPAWQSYTETAAFAASIKSRVSLGGNMRGYLASPPPAVSPSVLIDWIDNGYPSTNP